MNLANLDLTYSSDSQKMNDTALNTAFKYLSYRSRTVFELKRYIQKKGFDKETVRYVLNYLLTKGYLNDNDYCKSFLEYRSNYKPKSIFALKYELRSKGIDESIIDTFLSDYSDDELAQNAVKSKLNHWLCFDDDKFNKKVTNFLKYRGFSYTVCISILNNIKENIRKKNEN